MDAKELIKIIKSRDWPMDSEKCREAFKKSLGREPTREELEAMCPDEKLEPVQMSVFIFNWSLCL